MSEYKAKIEKAIQSGNKYGMELRKKREAAGKKASDGGLVGSMPKVLDAQLVSRFGGDYQKNDELMKDLRKYHPEMMAVDGDVPGDSPNGLHTARGRVSYTRRGGKWYHWNGTEWEEKAPPSKMDWSKPGMPQIMG